MTNQTSDSIVMKILLPLVIIAASVGAFFAFGKSVPPKADSTGEATIPKVKTVSAVGHSGSFEIETDGVVAPFREIQLAAEVSGRVTEKNPKCRAGNYLAAGTLLFQIDPQDYDLEVQRLEKEVAQANVNLEEHQIDLKNSQELAAVAKRTLDLQRKESERYSNLLKRGAITDSDFDRQKQSELSAENNFLTLNGQVNLLTARTANLENARDLTLTRLDKAKLDLQRTRILMPVDGVVVSDSVEKDSFVQKGTMLASVEDTSAVEVKCSLETQDLYWIWQHAKATDVVSATAENELASQPYAVPPAPVSVEYQIAGRTERTYVWQGKFGRYDGIGVDERTRTIPCRIVVNDPRSVTTKTSLPQTQESHVTPPALVRGMFVTVRIRVQPAIGLVKIPEEAVRPGKRVWTATGGKLEIAGPVQLVKRVSESDDSGQTRTFWLIEPTQELTPGALVIKSPLSAAAKGMSVQAEQEQN